MNLSAVLVALLLAQPAPAAETPAAAPSEQAPPTTAAAPVTEAPAEGAHAVPPEAAGHEDSHSPGAILIHHVSDVRLGHLMVGPFDLGPTKHLLFFAGACLIVIVLVRWARSSYAGEVPKGPAALVETLVVFIRDEIAEKNIGHHDARKFTPLLCSFFFFILIAALLGLMPFSATSTGNVSVTLGLAVVSFVANQWAGISRYGIVHHYKAMIPPGLPVFLVPIMIPVEILGMFARPFALTVRLFANMVAGHMIITSLLLLIPLMAAVATYMGVLMIPVALGLSLFIMCLELLVALLQAFIFTLLTAIFIGMSAHPSH
jgi:F-type H+-transporting ATPase subunit a